VASTDPIGLQPSVPIAVPSTPELRAAPELRHDDIRRVRLYCRVAAVLKSLTLFLLVLLLAWLLDRWLDTPWVDGGNAGPLLVATLVAGARFALSEMRLRTYDIRLADGAVSYTYGRRHAYLPITHVQLIDTESSPLLRPMGLSRCVLHTAGGMVIISPVPVRFVSAIEQAMIEQRAGHPDAS
jgi:membrane protein YdbS with pleckstrin-like domain